MLVLLRAFPSTDMCPSTNQWLGHNTIHLAIRAETVIIVISTTCSHLFQITMLDKVIDQQQQQINKSLSGSSSVHPYFLPSIFLYTHLQAYLSRYLGTIAYYITNKLIHILI